MALMIQNKLQETASQAQAEQSSKLTLDLIGGRGGIRTHDLRLRRPTLYPAELPVQIHMRSSRAINYH